MVRYGITFPLETVPLREQRNWLRELADLGYTDAWCSEAQDLDGFVPLALASEWVPELRVGCAVLPVQTRGPAVMAMSAAAMAHAAPGRFVLGLGSSSEFIVSMQNARPHERPYTAVRDTVRFLRRALAGENANGEYESFTVQGFRLARKLQTPPPIFLAALRPGMLELAGREADGVILNYTGPDDYAQVLPYVKKHGADKEIVQRLYVCPTSDPELAYERARRSISAYLSVPTYRAHQEWLGHGDLFAEMWACADQGDRKGARRAVSDAIVDRYFIIGPPERCRERIAEFVEAGLETPVLALVEEGGEPMEMARALAPGRPSASS